LALDRIALAFAILGLATGSAQAAPNFTNVACDSPAFEKFVLGQIGHGKNVFTGAPMQNRFFFGPITAASMVSNTGSSITCEISIAEQIGGSTRNIHGLFIATGTGWKWRPGY